MNIIHYIRLKLLQDGEAILPKIGTFATSYQSAQFDKRTKDLKPPIKTVKFSFSEDISDDSLAKYIVEKDKADYKKVEEEINNYVSKIWRALNRSQKVHLALLGVLMNRDNTIVFEFDETQNYLPSAAGLEPLEAIPIAKDKPEGIKEFPETKTKPVKTFSPPPIIKTDSPPPKFTEKKIAQPPPPIPSPTPKKRSEESPAVEERDYFDKPQSPAFTIFLLIVAILLILVLLDPFYIGFIERKKPGLSPLLEHKEDKSEKIDKVIRNSAPYKSAIAQDQEIRKEDKQDKAKDPEVKKETEVKEPEEKQTTTTSSQDPIPPSQQYHIIIASYYNLTLAREGKQNWENRGYSVNIIGPAKNGYYRISLGQYNDMNTANKDLRKVRNDIVSDAWLLKY